MANDKDSDYGQSAQVVYIQLRQKSEFALRMQAEYGKWLIASLLVLHSAAIGTLLFKGSVTGSQPIVLAAWFVAGVVLALSAGFFAWWNFTSAYEVFDKMADYRMLRDRKHWPQGDSQNTMRVTQRLSLSAGVLSLLAWVLGVAHLMCMLRY